ncbi:MAG: hypothetical protein JO035_15575 [Betaproteobacteria bacterium]|nr:hypothetical protein [Betaproteobacteria bacterium]
MHPAVTGALAGLGLAVVIFVLDYMMVSRHAAERAARYKKKAELDPTEKKALSSLFWYLLLMPPAGAFLFWIFR